MKKEKFSLFTFLRKGLCTLLALWVLLAAPTGWLYDLWAGEGSGQGQRPDDSVSLLRRQEEVEAFFLSGAPATVSGGQRVACPLARLRDPGQSGIHHRNGPGRGSVYVSEHIAADYPLSPWARAVQSVVGGFYNRYYLLELDDGTYLCTYFDDYLTLMGGEYPAGTVRPPPPKSGGCWSGWRRTTKWIRSMCWICTATERRTGCWTLPCGWLFWRWADLR